MSSGFLLRYIKALMAIPAATNPVATQYIILSFFISLNIYETKFIRFPGEITMSSLEETGVCEETILSFSMLTHQTEQYDNSNTDR
jgi:hypothetical protein